jgi:hypothetical protein
VDNLRWVTIQKNRHNRVDNNEHVNIIKRNGGNGYRVQFCFRYRKRTDRTLNTFDGAIEFRDVIQRMIDNNKEICPIFEDLFGNDMKHISSIWEISVNHKKTYIKI